ncbi:hypothetical protein JCM3774_002568 [Rhodotorula dairenensis]
MPALTPPSEIDELADDPALQPRPTTDPARLAEPARKRALKPGTASAAGSVDNVPSPARGRPPAGKKRRTEPSSEVAGSVEAARGTRLDRFRYAGPPAGPHQRIDPNTLSDTTASSDPVDAHAAPVRPPKRAPSPDLPPSRPAKQRTLSASNRGETGTRGLDLRATKVAAKEFVFVMPEFDEDGKLIEDENENSMCSPPPRRAPATAPTSSPAVRPPSSVELPAQLALRIYQDSPRKQTERSPCAAPPGYNDSPAKRARQVDADSARQHSSPAGQAGSASHALLTTPCRASPAAGTSSAQRSGFRPAQSEQPFRPKSLSTADLLAVKDVLADLDSQAFLDSLDDFDLPDKRKESTAAALDPSRARARTQSPNACSAKALDVATASASKSSAPVTIPEPQLAYAIPGEPFALARPKPQTQETEPVTAPVGQLRALPSQPSVPTFRLDPKPFRLPPSPQKRPPSYRLVSNNLEGAIAHLRTVVAHATEQRDSSGGAHQVEYLRGEVSRLATELEFRDAAIGELSDEVRALRTRLEGAHRREEAWAREREEWDAERQEWAQRVDVLKEIRRGLLGELSELRALLPKQTENADDADSDEEATPEPEVAETGTAALGIDDELADQADIIEVTAASEPPQLSTPHEAA